VHSRNVGRLIILIIDLLAVIKRYLVILILITKPHRFIDLSIFCRILQLDVFVERVYSLNFVLLCIPILNI